MEAWLSEPAHSLLTALPKPHSLCQSRILQKNLPDSPQAVPEMPRSPRPSFQISTSQQREQAMCMRAQRARNAEAAGGGREEIGPEGRRSGCWC